MPLVVMCGYPCSGKTMRRKQLVEYLKENHPDVKVIVVGDDESQIAKNSVYSESKHERAVRGSLKSEVNRYLTKDDVVILDSLNYIKGYRYELHCLIKYTRTPHCVIHTEVSHETAMKWNNCRNESEKYNSDVMEALLMRFEAPESRNRWDSPLFTIQVDDELPGLGICDALFHQKTPKPNMSTQNPPLMKTEYIYEVGKKTQDIVSAIFAAQKMMLIGDSVVVPGTKERYFLSQTLTLSQLRRFRQQFLNYIKSPTTSKVDDISKTFLLFLNKCVETC